VVLFLLATYRFATAVVRSYSVAKHELSNLTGKPELGWVAVISAKNHKRPRRKRQSRKVANAKGLNRNANLTQPNLN